MTKRAVRHSTKYAKAIPFAVGVLVLSSLVGLLLRGAWRWAVVEHNVVPGIVTLYSGLVLLLLVLMLIREAGRSWLRWAQEQEAEDSRRCVLSSCDRPLSHPFIFDHAFGGGMHPECFRRVVAGEATDELPTIARRAGA